MIDALVHADALVGEHIRIYPLENDVDGGGREVLLVIEVSEPAYG